MGHFAGLLSAVSAGTHRTRAVPALPSRVPLWGLQRARDRGFSPASHSRTSGQRRGRGAAGAGAQAPAGGESRRAPPGSTASPPPSPVASRGGGRSAGDRLTSPLRLPCRGSGKLSGSQRRKNAGASPSPARPSSPALGLPEPHQPLDLPCQGLRGASGAASRHRCSSGHFFHPIDAAVQKCQTRQGDGDGKRKKRRKRKIYRKNPKKPKPNPTASEVPALPPAPPPPGPREGCPSPGWRADSLPVNVCAPAASKSPAKVTRQVPTFPIFPALPAPNPAKCQSVCQSRRRPSRPPPVQWGRRGGGSRTPALGAPRAVLPSSPSLRSYGQGRGC